MIATRLPGILGMVLAVAVSAPAKTDSYTNPVIRGMNLDPSIVGVGSEYFLTTSSLEYFPSCAVDHSVWSGAYIAVFSEAGNPGATRRILGGSAAQRNHSAHGRMNELDVG